MDVAGDKLTETGRDWDVLRRLIVATGIGWSIAFVLLGVGHGLQMYGDGSFFSYAVAVEEAWAYHWHNISGRVFVYLLAHAPAELYVHLTSDARGGINLYGLLFFAGPLVGLAVTRAIDASPDRCVFVVACLSTACVCPLIFGCPTEIWMSHAVFWPALAACHRPRASVAETARVFALLLALVLTHEGAVLFALTSVATTLLHGARDLRVQRAAGALTAAMIIWAGVKWWFPPDPYLAEVLGRNALNLLNLRLLVTGVTVLLPLALVAYGALLFAFGRWRVARAEATAALFVIAGLCVFWWRFDRWLLADSRYYLRTAVLAVTPVLGCFAVVLALAGERTRLAPQAWLVRLITAGAAHAVKLSPRHLTGALALVVIIHAVETVKFVRVWDAYLAGLAALSMEAQPGLPSDALRPASPERLGQSLNRVSWFSTTQYLSVLVAPGLAPVRLVADPDPLYFWIDCATARRTETARKAVPVRSRMLLRQFTCLHRTE